MTDVAPEQPAAIPPDFVHEGLDGWLFLQAGSNFVTSLYARESGNLPDSRLAAWRDAIEDRHRRCAAMGIACAFVVVPDKLTIYRHKMAAPLVDAECAPAIRLHEMLQPTRAANAYVDLVQPMRACCDATDLYWRTDTHWAPAGCHLAYQAICDRLSIRGVADLLARPCQDYDRVMDLGGRMDPLRWERIRRYDYIRDSRRVSINRITRYLEDPAYREEIHVGAQAVFENGGAPDTRHAMLIGDSYSAPSPSLMTAMFAETFRRLDFVWSSSIDWQFVRTRKPDLLIFQIAERFMAVPPQERVSFRRLEWKQAIRAGKMRWARRREQSNAPT
jgi:alginate O-acetyltransferase complex protein AlgJ